MFRDCFAEVQRVTRHTLLGWGEWIGYFVGDHPRTAKRGEMAKLAIRSWGGGGAPAKKPKKRRRTALARSAAGTAIVLAALAPVQPSDAYVFLGPGCRYDPKNDDDGLGIGFKTTDSLYNTAQRNSTEYAASEWNSKVSMQFTVVGFNSAARDLKVEWSNLGPNTGGSLSYSCNPSAGHYNSDPIFYWGANQTYYTSTQNRRKAVAVHEEGHSYGLDHNNNGSCDYKVAGLMYTDAVGKYDDCGWFGPTTDDANGAVDAHY